jgi:cysteine desulfurase
VNVPAILAAAAALRAREAERETVAARQRALVERIRKEIARTVPDIDIVGDPVRRLPHIVTFSCLYASGEALLLELDRLNFSVSSGSSCTASTLTPSHVLVAMGVLSHGNVRVSLPWRISEQEVEAFLTAAPAAVARVRSEAPGADSSAPAVARQAAAVDRAPAAGDAAHVADGPSETIDALGRKCPIPVIELARRITRVPVGATVRVLADDPAARLDIPAWSELREHRYLGETPVREHGENAVAYLVRREH